MSAKPSGAGIMADDAVCSLALQHGVPLDTIRRAVSRSAGSASGPFGGAPDAVADGTIPATPARSSAR